LQVKNIRTGDAGAVSAGYPAALGTGTGTVARPSPAMSVSHALRTSDARRIPVNFTVTVVALLITAASSTSAQWHPVLDVLAFIAVMVVCDLLPFKTHTARVSGGLTVLVTIMACSGRLRPFWRDA
jgi:hypothetical protein